MSGALDMLRAIARSDAAQSPANERNEINEITSAGEQVNSFNSFLSCSHDVGEEEFEERAALIEFGAGVPREWAEGFAKLSPDRVPVDVPPHRWQRFVDDVGRFLDGGFADQASALGWTPLDLFGADPDKPFARIDRAGLLWLLNGSRLVALTDDAATIETETGARQTYRRKPNAAGSVLAWDLAHGRKFIGGGPP